MRLADLDDRALQARYGDRLGISADECYVVGDAVWDLIAARQAHMLSMGLLSGGYGRTSSSERALSASTVTRRSCASRSTSSASSPDSSAYIRMRIPFPSPG